MLKSLSLVANQAQGALAGPVCPLLATLRGGRLPLTSSLYGITTFSRIVYQPSDRSSRANVFSSRTGPALPGPALGRFIRLAPWTF